MNHLGRCGRTSAALGLLVAFFCVESHALGQASSFPTVDPKSQGMDPAALAQLAAVVQGYIDEESALGAELLVIKNRRTVLHQALGSTDRETDQPMVKNTN